MLWTLKITRYWAPCLKVCFVLLCSFKDIPGCYIKVCITTCPFGIVKYKFNEKHLPNLHFHLPPKEKELFFVLKVVHVPQYTFSLPDSGNCFFSVFQNACPNLKFTCPGQSGKCLSIAPCILVFLFVLDCKASLLSNYPDFFQFCFVLMASAWCPYEESNFKILSKSYMNYA